MGIPFSLLDCKDSGSTVSDVSTKASQTGQGRANEGMTGRNMIGETKAKCWIVVCTHALVSSGSGCSLSNQARISLAANSSPDGSCNAGKVPVYAYMQSQQPHIGFDDIVSRLVRAYETPESR